MYYICSTKFEAIHNKDFSVVKTLRAGPSGLAFLLDSTLAAHLYNQRNL